MADIIGRQISYGIGKETTRGTAVSAGHWLRHLSADLWTKVDKTLNESANGTNVKYNDSDIARQWAEGTLEGKVQTESFGMVLLGALGTVASVANADASGDVYNHTFSIANSSTPQSLTIVQKSANADRAYALAMVDNLNITAEAGEYVKFNMGVTAKKHASATSTVAYIDETEFTSKHITAKMAANVAGLTGATAIDVESVSLDVNRNLEPYFAHGSVDVSEINSTTVEITGSITLRWDASTYEDLFYADTKQAFQLVMDNTDVTIGTAANPSITITVPKASIETLDVDQSLDAVVKQTVTFVGLFDTATAKLADVVLTNTTATY